MSTEDDRVAELVSRIEELEEEQQNLKQQYQATKEQNEQVLNLFEQFKSGRISRRAFLTSVSAVAGVAWFAGSAQAAPSWSNASGNSGTESKPLSTVYAQTGRFQSINTDNEGSFGSVSTDDADINSTAIDVYVSSNQSLGSGANKTVQLDTEVDDNLGEFDPSTHELSVNDTGKYSISGYFEFQPDSAGDRVVIKFENKTDGEQLVRVAKTATDANRTTVPFSMDNFPLDSSKVYEVIARDVDSAATLTGGKERSRFMVRSDNR